MLLANAAGLWLLHTESTWSLWQPSCCIIMLGFWVAARPTVASQASGAESCLAVCMAVETPQAYNQSINYIYSP